MVVTAGEGAACGGVHDLCGCGGLDSDGELIGAHLALGCGDGLTAFFLSFACTVLVCLCNKSLRTKAESH